MFIKKIFFENKKINLINFCFKFLNTKLVLNLIKLKKINIILNLNFLNEINLKLNYIFCKNINYIYINNEKYNYNLIEHLCYSKFENIKLSIIDFCSIIGIFIPHYCYHPDLSIAGNCRMCLIQLETSIKPIASCAILTSKSMIINTNSIFVKKLQEVF